MSQGVDPEPPRRHGRDHRSTRRREITEQHIPGGPFASQEAIKELGTNGGGPYNANSAHPFENPNGFTNILEIYALLLIPLSLVVAFGRLVKDKRQARVLLAVMVGHPRRVQRRSRCSPSRTATRC